MVWLPILWYLFSFLNRFSHPKKERAIEKNGTRYNRHKRASISSQPSLQIGQIFSGIFPAKNVHLTGENTRWTHRIVPNLGKIDTAFVWVTTKFLERANLESVFWWCDNAISGHTFPYYTIPKEVSLSINYLCISFQRGDRAAEGK